jgi:hypothetical protein
MDVVVCEQNFEMSTCMQTFMDAALELGAMAFSKYS